MKIDIEDKMNIPEGVEVTVEHGVVSAKGPKGEVSKLIRGPNITIDVKDNKVVLSSKKATKREKRMIGTFKSHIDNLMKGAAEGHVYRLKIASSHFPMTAAENNGEFTVQNFLGEKVPRVLKVKEGAAVKIEGDIITIESADKEAAGQTAGDIEQMCRITNRDRRIFQDGIYIIEKSRKAK